MTTGTVVAALWSLSSMQLFCDPMGYSLKISSVQMMGCHFVFQRIFLTQGSNLPKPHLALQADSLPLHYQGSPLAE